MNKDLIDWEARVALLTTEIERLRNVNIIKDQEIDQWKLRYQKLEMQLSEFCLLKEKNKVLN